MPRGSVCIAPELLDRCEGTIMRMAVARGIHPGVEPVILHLETRAWRRLRIAAAKCPYTPTDIKQSLALARKVFISRNNARLVRMARRRRRR